MRRGAHRGQTVVHARGELLACPAAAGTAASPRACPQQPTDQGIPLHRGIHRIVAVPCLELTVLHEIILRVSKRAGGLFLRRGQLMPGTLW